VAFIATHLPLLSIVAYLLLKKEGVDSLMFFWLTLGATLVGTAFAFWILHQLLQPVMLAGKALQTYKDHLTILDVPTDLRDETGGLLRHVKEVIGEIDKQRTQLERIAQNDYLTGLPNRRAATERLMQEILSATPDTEPLSLALIDIDYFKRLNDSFGHEVGDSVLCEFAHAMRTVFERQGGWVARWGGEEFLAVLPYSLPDAEELLNRFRAESLCRLPHPEIPPITFSAGVTEVQNGDSLHLCLRRADYALYQAKHSGRNRVLSHQEKLSA
jgi:diguanylate cyclase (GGDEF)-like protein